jgi:leucyl/phenylalanyl-tRNA---protein transferase
VLAWLRPDAPFPPLSAALAEPNGLLAAGGDLSPERLIAAYRRGIFPWYSAGQPILWWSPDPRMVLFVDEFKVSRSLAKSLRSRRFEIRIDTAFRDVVDSCAAMPRRGQRGTWITPEMIDAYVELHVRGFAHSVEAWHDGRLCGGLYGMALGRMFFGESMFARTTDASKVALVHLVALLKRQGVPLIDCQQETAHLGSFGARPIRRPAFAEHLTELINSTGPVAGWRAGDFDSNVIELK